MEVSLGANETSALLILPRCRDKVGLGDLYTTGFERKTVSPALAAPTTATHSV